MDNWSDETKEIMEILRDCPDLKFPVLMLALEAAAADADQETETR